MMSEIKALLSQLIACESITPQDASCQDLMISTLEKLGFECQRFDNPPVANFFARFGHQAPLLVFAGHTDVVPVGDTAQWTTNPFTLEEKDGLLYGRGTADMKGSLAAMLHAAERFVTHHKDSAGSLGFLITSGEEGDEFQLGTPYVMEQLHQQGIHLDYCVVGEPSSTKRVGDVIKIGRRGSLTARINLQGKQGHVAYPHLAQNPIHQISPALLELTSTTWDQGNAHFPPTTMQITHIESGGFASNIIPGQLTLQLNFRYSTEQTDEKLKLAVHDCFSRHGLNPLIQWRVNGQPFLTAQGKLLQSTIASIQSATQQVPELSTSGGTSDGRFIAPYGVEVIELGPINASIHQVNECVSLADLEDLSTIYYLLCEQLLVQHSTDSGE